MGVVLLQLTSTEVDTAATKEYYFLFVEEDCEIKVQQNLSSNIPC